jgi:hypothetical protein
MGVNELQPNLPDGNGRAVGKAEVTALD